VASEESGETVRVLGRFVKWLDRPLPGRQCVLSWALASIVFFGMVALLGGPIDNDSGESLYATWAVEHGDLGCAFPSITYQEGLRYLPEYRPGPHVPPLWPLVSGGVAFLTRIGHEVAFPSAQTFGHDCSGAYFAIYGWAHQTRAQWPTLGLGYLAWFPFLAGVIAVLRASGRGRRGWEALGVLLVALVPIVWMPILDEFHPQDLLAMGLVLGGIACAQRRHWAWAGALLGLAVATQQFALLVLVPLFVIARSNSRWRLTAAAAGSWLLVALPFISTNWSGAWDALLFGTGNWTTYGGTVLWETGLRGHALLFASRVVPILVALGFAWWVRHRFGDRVFEPVILLSMLALALTLRLVFEQGIFGYKFLALAVMLVLLTVARGSGFAKLVVWIALVTLAWNPIPYGFAFNSRSWGYDAGAALPALAVGAALAVLVWDAAHHRVRWYLVAALVVAVCAFANWPLWALSPERAPIPRWLWQVILLTSGIALAAEPLVSALRVRRTQTPELYVPSQPRVGVTP
jgi:hypothetical protein